MNGGYTVGATTIGRKHTPLNASWGQLNKETAEEGTAEVPDMYDSTQPQSAPRSNARYIRHVCHNSHCSRVRV